MLAEQVPGVDSATSIVHGDYRLDNVIVDLSGEPRGSRRCLTGSCRPWAIHSPTSVPRWRTGTTRATPGGTGYRSPPG